MTSDRRTRRKRRERAKAYDSGRQPNLAPVTAGDIEEGSPLLVEPAWDGHRVLATRRGDRVHVACAGFRDWTRTFPSIVRALDRLAAKRFAIDGVACVMDERGAPSFERLRVAVASERAVTDAVLICWDLLSLDDEDLRARPLRERRRRLVELLAGAAPALVLSQPLDGALDRVIAAARAVGLRGVVARAWDGDHAASWRSRSTTDAPIDWSRSLSPPPPLSNPDKVLYPRDGIAKKEIVAYYRDVAPLVLPHLRDRPVVIQRWPDGIDDFDWYQHRMPPRAPDYLRAAWVDGIRRIVVENVDSLAWLANQAGLVFHGFASRLVSLAAPDYAVIDLDPGDRTTWADTIAVALAVRRTLELLELTSVVKTSGQRGLHVLVPLAPEQTFEHAEAFARGVARLLERLLPDLVTLENEKDKRAGRLLVDHRQHVAKTLVVPYSLRAVDGARVSTPIAWHEVAPSLDPAAFALRSLRARLDAVGDLAAPLLAGTARLDRALAQLAAQVR
jgi:bifunctional non-homologous end joining protein LigD